MASVPLPAPDIVPDTPFVGRTITAENFPVVSRLLAAEFRPVIIAYYEMARAADDVADHPRLSSPEKLRRLETIDAVLAGRMAPVANDPAQGAAATVRAMSADRGLTIEHARHLLQAFRTDAVNRPCRSWSDLLAYCRYSAAPAGRFMLELHGESRNAWPAAEALCAALQILGHLQDCQTDWRDLGRLYIPQDWLNEARLPPDALLGSSSPASLRRVLNRVLDGVDRLLDAARPLPRSIVNRGLRMQAFAVLAIARVLARRLRRADPLARRIGVSNLEKALALGYGALRGWRR